MANPAGNYDPIPAGIYGPTTTLTNGEPVQTKTLLKRQYIRFPYQARTGYETPVQHQQVSVGQIVIRMRDDAFTRTITPAMEIHHRGSIYGIISPNPLMVLDELEFLCQYQTLS